MVLRLLGFICLNSYACSKHIYKVLITMNINNLSFTLTWRHPENNEYDVKLVSLDKWAYFSGYIFSWQQIRE